MRKLKLNNKFIEIAYFSYIAITSMILFYWIIKTKPLWDPFELRPFGILPIVYIFTIILSILGIIQLTKYYYEIGSYDYLLVALIIHGIGFIFWVGQGYLDFIINIKSENAIEQYKTLQPEMYFLYVPIFLGYLLFLVLAINIHGWNDLKKPIKIICIFSIYWTFTIILNSLERTIFSIQNPSIGYPEILQPSVTPITVVLILIFFNIFHLTIIQSLQYIIGIYILMQIKPHSNFKSVHFTKKIWISIHVLLLIQRNISDYVLYVLDNYDLSYQIWSYVHAIIMLIFVLTLIKFPEALLISTSQLVKAKKLYNFYNTKNVEKDHEISMISDHKIRMEAYLMSLSEELKVELHLSKVEI
ncbi:MAG: hypothetical protein OEZ01_06155 [Candidatus Heimdallarchaeota archaeon]|nr:hypothetical protein [Candidatus Heimdallarchaeota archaeon]MDH5645570.1 hypothetical protein [Candidatus Heimdallarchaeota archaeon]